MSGLYLYSLPHEYLHPRTRDKVYSRPCAWSGESGGSVRSYKSKMDKKVDGTRGAPRMR